MTPSPSPEALRAADLVLQEARRWPVELDMEGFDSTQQTLATLIDAEYASLRERCERLERESERLRAIETRAANVERLTKLARSLPHGSSEHTLAKKKVYTAMGNLFAALSEGAEQ